MIQYATPFVRRTSVSEYWMLRFRGV